MWCKNTVAAVFIALLAASAFGRDEFVPAMPDDLEQVDISLLTVGFGETVDSAFGHTMVRVRDRKAQTDMVFNWGVFDFNDPWFIFDFAYGRLNYWMSINSVGTTMRIYQYERRRMVENLVYFTAEQKRRLMEKIIWQAQPENRRYLYHYYFDNCSTRVRDYFDFALYGTLSERFLKEDVRPERETLRESIQQKFGYFPLVGMATDIVMNSDLDKNMTAWQEMYLPGALQKYLSMMPRVSDAGVAIPGSNLLSDDRVVLPYPAPEPYPFSGYHIVTGIFGVLLALGAALMLRARSAVTGFRIFGIAMMSWGTVSGLFSFAMLWYWLVSVHIHGFHNANLWLMWPTDLLWLWYGIKWLKKGRALPATSAAASLLRGTCLLHILTIPLFLLLFLTGIIEQDVSYPLLYLAPLTFFGSLVTVRLGFFNKVLVSNESKSSATAH